MVVCEGLVGRRREESRLYFERQPIFNSGNGDPCNRDSYDPRGLPKKTSLVFTDVKAKVEDNRAGSRSRSQKALHGALSYRDTSTGVLRQDSSFLGT